MKLGKMNKNAALALMLLMLVGPVGAQSLPQDRLPQDRLPQDRLPQEQVLPQTKAMTLQECIAYALKNNEDIAKAVYDQQISENQVKEVKGSGLPQISGSGKLEYYPSLPTQILPGAMFGMENDLPVQFGKDYNVQGGLQVSQLLFSKSFFIGLQAAKSAQDLYQLRKEMTEEEVVYNISSSYLMILQTQEQFNIINANLERLAQLEKILQLQYENDLVKKVDLNRVKVNRVNLQNQKQSLTTGLEQQLNYLKFFMGMPLEQTIALNSEGGLGKNIIPLASGAGINPDQKIEYRLLNKQKELTDYQIKNIQAGYYPTLAAYGNYSYLTQRNELFASSSESPWFNTTVVGLQLNVPIFDGFQKRSKVRQAALEVKKVDEDIKKLNKNTQVEVENAISQLENSRMAIAAQEENVALAQEVYDTSNQLYKEGISPLTDLLEAEVSLREAQTNLNNEKLKNQIAQLNYLKATGEIASLTK
ncbi:TolC family protein [Cesiribacter sp. SM1]|uniref:TolC family protein n=1 Tax=Cesiribacter sp. SM1 TaxID=2861196 RepID=UPI001CD77C50|nr:TolC family protein [Cesiribacter sp. SM1]